jgi:hypothetical protein
MWANVLAWMLFLLPPGKSIYSRLEVPQDAPRPCGDPYSLLCQAPQWSASRQAWTVAEDYRTGLERYRTIAEAVSDVVAADRWKSPRGRLSRLLVVAMFHESGFRRDVHEGIGPASRGDCRWRNGRRVPGSCKSHCLTQIQLGKGRSAEGWSGDDLVGTNPESTRRCLTVAARILDGAAMWCATRGPRPWQACVWYRYSGGNVPTTDHRVQARARTFNALAAAPELSDAVRAALDTEP